MTSSVESSNDKAVLLCEAARCPSGKSFLDSGGDSGRHWQKPPIPVDAPEADWDRTGDDGEPWGAALETPIFLANHTEIATGKDGHDLNKLFEIFAELWPNMNWFEAGERFMIERGYHQHARENTYNHESDLSQCFVWELYTKKEEEDDWIWADESVLVVYVHTGADVRGGYSNPVFLVWDGDYAAPLDIVCQFYVDSGTLHGEPLTDNERRSIDEKWECGYSQYPFGQVRDDVEFWLPTNELKNDPVLDDGLRVAVLKSGEVVSIGVTAPWA